MSITPLYAGLLALWFLALSIRVTLHRGRGPSLGDGGDPALLRVIRAHANFAEYVPLILLMMAMLEWGGMRGWLMHVIGVALLIGRLLHGYALSFTQKWKFGRYYGTVLTYVVLLVTAVLCVWRGVVALML